MSTTSVSPEYEKLLPPVTEANSAYWEGCEVGELRLQRCTACGTHRFPEGPVCPHCLSPSATWEPTSGRGTLWSWIVMHQRYFAAFADRVPYNVAFVQLQEGPFMISSLTSDVGARCGAPVRVVFEQLGEARWIPRFELAANVAGGSEGEQG